MNEQPTSPAPDNVAFADFAHASTIQLAGLVRDQSRFTTRFWFLINVTFVVGFACGRYGQPIADFIERYGYWLFYPPPMPPISV